MRQVVVYAFYLWLALSFLYLVVQMARKLTSRSTDVKPAEARRVVTPDAAQPSGPDPVATLLAEEAALLTEGAVQVESEAGRSEPDTLRVPAETAAPAPSYLDTLPPPPPSIVLDTSAPDASMPMAAPETTGPMPDRAGLAELLAGIRLPHDLMPVIPDGMVASDSHVSLLTSSAPAGVVGSAIADELERLGYVLEAKSGDELVARRQDDELVLGIVTTPALLSDGGRPRYPTAADGDVLVTIDAAS